MTLATYTSRVARHLIETYGSRKAPSTFRSDVEAMHNTNYVPSVAAEELAKRYGWSRDESEKVT